MMIFIYGQARCDYCWHEFLCQQCIFFGGGGGGGVTGISIWEEYFVEGWFIFLVLKEAFQEHFSATWKPDIDVCICNRKSKLVA